MTDLILLIGKGIIWFILLIGEEIKNGKVFSRRSAKPQLKYKVIKKALGVYIVLHNKEVCYAVKVCFMSIFYVNLTQHKTNTKTPILGLSLSIYVSISLSLFLSLLKVHW